MKLDRALQRALLQALADDYPKAISAESWKALASQYGDDVVRANALYLDGHGLVTWNMGSAGFRLSITPAGLDFLADDGGLTAILSVVTIKFHEDTLRELIGLRIAESDLAQPDKKRLLDQLRELPGETIKHLTLKLVDAGLANWPVALQAIGTFLISPAH
ncbi:hypothetical protein [Paraburkholderia sp. MM5477-R1]|uniref:hypothetical protein n=1 Tax=Paraburkholderia sp. MM5477-R1 TaxID=2991062 RepID=UPI003D1A973C